ncbi:MAG: exopolysaccharide biosynthesis polyprenyl glycosylphosphotransferase [Aeromicrobium sp.]
MTSAELGAEREGVRAKSGVHRFGGARSLPSWPGPARVPAASYVLACGVAVVVAAVVARRAGPAVWFAVAVVVGTLFLELVAVPSYERNRTLAPVRHLLVTAGTGLLAASAFAWLDPQEVRWAAVVVVTAAAVLVGAVVATRSAGAPRTVLLVGGRVGVAQLIAQWSTCRDVEVKGVCLPELVDAPGHQLGPVPIVGSLDDAAAVAQALAVDQVVIVPGPLLSAPHVRRVIWALEALPAEISIVAEMDGVAPRRVTARMLGRRLTLSVRPSGHVLPAMWVKGAVDRLVAALLLVVLSPLLLAVALLIRLDSPGPVIFRQTRVGRGGESFTIFKFRTMHADAETRLAGLTPINEGAGPLFKVARDPRTTRVGRTLRCTSIDEVPQLVNVLRGEMSLIGPRPGLPVETMTYDEWVHRRLRVKPGMTGAWQVGGRSNLSWAEAVRLDIDYVDNATLRDDLRIAARTVRVVISRDGAV